MSAPRRLTARRSVQGVTLIELVVVIVLLAVLAVGFMAMYAAVTRRSAVADQIAPMTWLAEGAMEAVLAERPPASSNTTFNAPPYTVTMVVQKTTMPGPGQYQATVTVSCASGSCQSVIWTDYAYAIK